VLADSEFEVIQPAMAEMGMGLNCAAEGEHVPVIEQYIHTVKERVQGIYNTLPFTRYPNQLVVEMVYAAVF